MGEIRKILPRSGSLQVTIPRRWCREMKLTKGSFVELVFDWYNKAVTITALKGATREAASPAPTAREAGAAD